MGLTGDGTLSQTEQNWITSLYLQHSMFCNCGDPLGHLVRCLRTHITVDEGIEDEVISFAMAEPFDDGDDTGNGTGDGPALADGYVDGGLSVGASAGATVVVGRYVGVALELDVEESPLDSFSGLRGTG
ncbi:ORF2 [torque teno Delphinidae virus 50]